jgi:hypothetical protein
MNPAAQLVVDSTKATAAKLKSLEDILFGTNAVGTSSASKARLPLPNEVITLFSGS